MNIYSINQSILNHFSAIRGLPICVVDERALTQSLRSVTAPNEHLSTQPLAALDFRAIGATHT